MAVDRIEVAVECDDVEEDGVTVLALIVEALGLDPERDVEAMVSSTDEGQPVLVAVLVHQGDDDDDI